MTTNLVPMMWMVWALVVAVTVVLTMYRSRIGRDEEGQIFLAESFDQEKAVQAAILGKINRIQPAVQVSLVLATTMSLVVIGYYVWFTARALGYIQ